MAVKTQNPSRSKIQTLEAMLKRRNGATLAEMTRATGWQVHSVRGAISLLNSAGRTIDRTTGRSGISRYRIVDGES